MKISTAYDAYWFLMEHPKMRCREARLLSAEEAKTIKLSPGERIRVVKDEMPWEKDKRYSLLEYFFNREAFPENLSIFWAKVDGSRKVNDDPKKNKFIECWLEFGPVKQVVDSGSLRIEHYHDINLDCGAPTFDEALVRLARLVKKHYGDIKTPGFIKKG